MRGVVRSGFENMTIWSTLSQINSGTQKTFEMFTWGCVKLYEENNALWLVGQNR